MITSVLPLFFAWNPWSWKEKTPYQLPTYPDPVKEQEVIRTIQQCPPLIFAGEAEELKKKLYQTSLGNRFVITGGNCAESFDQFNPNDIREDLRLLMQMSLLCQFGSGVPTIQIGRMAGQFAKPRSSPFEVYRNQSYLSYRGDIINDISFDTLSRTPDPTRMIRAYHQSTQTLNLLRAYLHGGYTKVNRMKDWKIKKVETETSSWYQQTMERIEESLLFLQTFQPLDLSLDSFYTGHESLLLPYEASLTRKDNQYDQWYDCSAHFLWLGERTRQLDSAQVEFLRGIHNPIGIKISSAWNEYELKELLDIVDPYHEPGKITLITRMGADRIVDALPPLIHAIQKMERNVVWCCDPMHGNTFSCHGRKTRSFQRIKDELTAFFDIHHTMGTIPGGIHLEMTSRNVTECIGGNLDTIQMDQLGDAYQSKCDPRLNGLQALEIAFLVGQLLQSRRKKHVYWK